MFKYNLLYIYPMSLKEQKQKNDKKEKHISENHKIVSQSEWMEARKDLLAKEKEFTILRDQVNKEYVFDGSDGKQTLSELFDGRSQLIIYHFMFGPSWDAGCPSCSFWA